MIRDLFRFRRNPPRLLLVTGSPRSGTTAVGRMLALPRGTCILHEPLNYHVGLRSVRRYFEVPRAGGFQTGDVDGLVERIRDLDLSYKSGVFPGDTGLTRWLKRFFGGRAVNSYRRCRFTPGEETIVWKDPFACFLARRLAGRHELPVVLTVRNPWAVAASFKRLEWGFDVRDLARRLREAGWEPYGRDGIAAPDELPPRDEPVASAAVLWSLVYGTLLAWKRAGADLRFVDLETIVTSPLPTYRELYRELELPWSQRIESRIRTEYAGGADRRVPREDRPHDSDRDLEAVNRYWRELLDDGEVEAVRALAGAAWREVSDACPDRPGRGAGGP